jgi:hypothetical protein
MNETSDPHGSWDNMYHWFFCIFHLYIYLRKNKYRTLEYKSGHNWCQKMCDWVSTLYNKFARDRLNIRESKE